MAVKYVDIPGFGRWTYDDLAGTVVFGTDGILRVTRTPTVSGDVLRIDDIGGGGLAAPIDSEYVVVGLDGDLTNERRLQVGSGLTLTDGGAGGDITIDVNTVTIRQSFDIYDPEPARGSVSNIHGGLLSLATGQPLDSVPTNIVVSKGIGKLMVVINAGSDVSGSIIVTGTSVDRDTGATTPADTDTLTVDALTTDGSDTDSNGNTRHSFTGAYITSKWFTGSVTLSTTNLTLTDVDVYHVSFEPFGDTPSIEVDQLDANIFTTNVAAEFDAYLYSLEVTGDKCNITREASINVGADGETAIANRYWRLKRTGIAKTLDGSADGVWVDIHYSNSPAYIEDVTLKVWYRQTVSLDP